MSFSFRFRLTVEGLVRVVRLVIRNFRLLYLMKFLKCWLCGVLRFVRTLTTSFWRLLHSNLRLRYIRQINMESDDECELDSTWEDEYKNKEPRKKNKRRSHRNMYAAKDMQDFRRRVRNLDDDDDDDDDKPGEGSFYNLEFYRGKINSSPDDVHIDEFHQQWKGQYDKLEDCHSYIQWLFPIQEPGVNWRAHVLTKKEIKLFRKDKEAKRKLVESYKLMLDFYGIHLVDESTGEVKRADNWKERFSNLNRYSHNNLRITRILKCLGTLGLQHYQAPLVRFFLHETLVKGQLQRVKQSILDYFMFTVLDKSERQDLVRFAFNHFIPREQFVWGPKKRLSGEVYSKNEENKNSNTAEHKQQRETDNGVKDQQAINIQPVDSGSDKNNKVKQDSDDNSQCSSGNKSVKENQKVSISDAKESGEVHNESENFDLLTENRTTEDGQQKETSERTQELNQTDTSNPVKIMLNEINSEKDQQTQDIRPIKNEQDPTENRQCSSNTKKVEKQDQKKCNESNEGKKILSGSQVVHGENKNFSQATDKKCSRTAEDEQERVKLHESTDERSKIYANRPSEVMENETPKDHQNIDKPDSPNKLTGNNIESDQGANEDTINAAQNAAQCSSENKSVKQNQDMSDGDDDVGMTTKKDNNTHDVNQIDASNHVKGMVNDENSGKDLQVKTGLNTFNEDKQDPNQDRQ